MSTNRHPKFTAELLPTGASVDTQNHVFDRRVVCVCTLTIPNRVTQFQGVSIRSPQDRWNPALGLDIALNRAIKNWWISEHHAVGRPRLVEQGVLPNGR